MGVSNIPDALPKSQEECELLETVIDRLLTSIPEVWDSVDQQKLTAIEQRGLLLLTAAGMVERRFGMRISSAIDRFTAEIDVTATGEYGFIEALQLVIAQMWETAKDAYPLWRATHADVPSAHCEVLHESWRLTDQGIVARNDLGKTQHDRGVVFNFVLRRYFFAKRPAVRGSGVLNKFIPATAPSAAPPASVSINNWDDGAKQFAAQFFSTFGQAMQAKSEAATAPVGQPSASEPLEVPRASERSFDGPRKKRSKEETTKLVHAAIAFKMKNPEWSESRCAEESGLSVSTLNGNAMWQEWKRKIVVAQNGGTLSAVKHEFDRRTGEFLPVDDSDSDDSE